MRLWHQKGAKEVEQFYENRRKGLREPEEEAKFADSNEDSSGHENKQKIV